MVLGYRKMLKKKCIYSQIDITELWYHSCKRLLSVPRPLWMLWCKCDIEMRLPFYVQFLCVGLMQPHWDFVCHNADTVVARMHDVPYELLVKYQISTISGIRRIELFHQLFPSAYFVYAYVTLYSKQTLSHRIHKRTYLCCRQASFDVRVVCVKLVAPLFQNWRKRYSKRK